MGLQSIPVYFYQHINNPTILFASCLFISIMLCRYAGSEDMLNRYSRDKDLTLYHIPDKTWYDLTEIINLRKRLAIITMIDASGPPVYFENLKSVKDPSGLGNITHHPQHAIYLKKYITVWGIDNNYCIKILLIKF